MITEINWVQTESDITSEAFIGFPARTLFWTTGPPRMASHPEPETEKAEERIMGMEVEDDWTRMISLDVRAS